MNRRGFLKRLAGAAAVVPVAAAVAAQEPAKPAVKPAPAIQRNVTTSSNATVTFMADYSYSERVVTWHIPTTDIRSR